MLNLELARIVVAERRRATHERVRQALLRDALAERASSADVRAAAGAEPCAEAAPARQVLGPSC